MPLNGTADLFTYIQYLCDKVSLRLEWDSFLSESRGEQSGFHFF
jgi:hypothetical protein